MRLNGYLEHGSHGEERFDVSRVAQVQASVAQGRADGVLAAGPASSPRRWA